MPKAAPAGEYAITDGMRHLGNVCPKAGGFEAYGSDGAYIAKFETLAEARKAVIAADRRQREAAHG